MDEGFALPCYQKDNSTAFIGSCDDHERDLSFLCPQFVPDGMLLTLQVHGNRNSMMQNMTYNPINQDPFFYFIAILPQLSPQTIGAYCYWFSLKSLQRNSPHK